MKFMKMIGALSVIVVAVGVANAQDAQTPTEICAAAPKEEPATREYTQAEQVLEAGLDYRAVFCTEAGAIYVDLFEKYAPVTVNNFVFLAENSYYNNTTFHRVLQDFMAQGGDPTGTGSGGPGYQFGDETPGFITFDRPGLLAMANAGPGTNGSQFFVTTSLPDYLNYRHTIFGDVLEGYENVVSLKLRDPEQNPAEAGAVLETVVIVTDPALVTSAFSEDITVATAEEIIAALDVSATLPEDLVASQNGLQTAEDIVSAAPEQIRADYNTFLETYGFQYRAAVEVTQTVCNEGYGFDLLGYRLDAFASEEDATAALADGFLDALAEARGYEKIESAAGTLAYKTNVTLCNSAEGALQQLIVPRGRYIATLYGSFSQDVLNQVTVDALLGNSISGIFESTLTQLLRSELR